MILLINTYLQYYVDRYHAVSLFNEGDRMLQTNYNYIFIEYLLLAHFRGQVNIGWFTLLLCPFSHLKYIRIQCPIWW